MVFVNEVGSRDVQSHCPGWIFTHKTAVPSSAFLGFVHTEGRKWDEIRDGVWGGKGILNSSPFEESVPMEPLW